MQNLEEMNKKYSLACVEAVQDTIRKLAVEWGGELINTLKENDFKIITEVYGNDFCIEAYVGRNGYYMPEKYADEAINIAVQEAFDNLPMQITLNAMIQEGAGATGQPIYWGIA